MTNDDEDNYSRRTGAVHVGVHSDVCYVKPKRGTRWKYDDCNNYDLCNSSYRNYGNVQDKTHSKFSKKPSPQIHSTKFAGVVHDGVCCNVCTLSPITGTRWKCSECPDYDMCHSCYKIYRHVHSKTHSFTKIGTPGSLSTKEQKKAHEVHETPSIMPSDLTKIKRDEHVKTVYLETSRKEFITVMGKFIQTLDKEIVSIRSVQNKYLWEFYFVKRGQMESINGKIGANEMNLYHGTKPDIIHTVCAQNLDMRLAGTNVGAILGNGTYFASAAHMSDSYATPDPNTGHKFMLQCRVLVGRWTKGQPGLQRPPEVAQTSDGQVRLYDSCVDRVRNPRVFCIFDHVQCYPEYIIEYK